MDGNVVNWIAPGVSDTMQPRGVSMVLMGLLPIVFLAAVWIALAGRGRMIGAAVLSWVIFGVVVFVLTEGASLWHGLSPVNARISWSILTAAAVAWAGYRIKKERRPLPDLRLPWRREPLGVGMCATVAMVTFVVAIISPPNTWDSLTYHMPRVMVWMQNQTLRPPFLSDSRMVFMPPWAEYSILQFQLLSGSDRYANIPQWLAGLVCMIGACGIARLMKIRSAWACSLAAILVATNPMTILQMSSTQTDLATSAFTVCAVWLIVLSIRRFSWRLALWQGAAIGLAILTKQTAVFFLAPFCIWSGILAMLRGGRLPRLGGVDQTNFSTRRTRAFRLIPALRRGLGYGIVVAVVLGAINLPHHLRTQSAPNAGKGQVDQNSNDRLGVDVLASNFVRNGAMHVQAILERPFWFNGVKRTVEWLHGWIGIPADDRDTTTFPTYVTRGYSTGEDLAGSPVQFVLELAAVIGIVFFARRQGWRAWGYALCIVAGTLIMLAVLKWSPYRQRYHLPLMILAVVPVAGSLQTWLASRRLQIAVVTMAVLYAIPCLITNSTRPIIRMMNLAAARSIFVASRTELLFATNKRRQSDFEMLADALADAGARRVAVFRGDTFEYAIWTLAGEKIPGLEIVHVPWKGQNAPISGVDARIYIGKFAKIVADAGWPADHLSQEMLLIVDKKN